ncbi:MAG: hypothetical protein B7W98_00540 [Parcubacteria group bacterium 20-58-5]|nr:MAG: hypothetical protein B7W98_00540 [Parcubacteria group bacterium 20-58-5]
MAQTNAVALPGISIQINVPKDSVAKRNRKIRWVTDILIVFLTFYVPYRTVGYVGGTFGHSVVGSFIGSGIGVYLLGLLMPRMLVDNAEWSGYVTQNPLGKGIMIPYGPGLHPALPWEERNEDGNYSLRVITRPFTLTSPTKTSAVTIQGRLFYNASLRFLINAVGVDKEVVEEGLIAFIDSDLIPMLAELDAETAVTQTAEISRKLNKIFRDTPAVTPNAIAKPEEFEEKFGYSTAAIVIDKIAYAPKVQEALDAVSKARKMNEIAAELLGVTKAELAEMLKEKVITVKQVKEVLDRALVTSGNAKMQLNVIEGDMAAAVAGFLGKGGQP